MSLHKLLKKLKCERPSTPSASDVIEAGFPLASPGDFEEVQTIAREVKGRNNICALARANEKDVQKAIDALKDAERSTFACIHCYFRTSYGI